MTLAAKHYDLVVGTDFHNVVVPTGTVVLLPTPFIGFVFEINEYLPLLRSTVLVHGLPSAHAGSGCLAMPHAPVGGEFLPPGPGRCGQIFTGSASVAVQGAPMTYDTLAVLSCQSIGLPPPPLPKVRSALFQSAMLPASVVLAIPMAQRVTVSGTPVASIAELAWLAAEKLWLHPLAKSLAKRALRLSGLMAVIKRRVRRASKALAARLGLAVQEARNRIDRALCTLTGHPVDVATGKVLTEKVDFELPGPIPLRWERVWYSTSGYRGPLGQGWHGSYDAALYVTNDVVLYRTPDGRLVPFPPLPPDTEHFERDEGLTLVRGTLGYSVRSKDGLIRRFRDIGRPDDEHVLSAISDGAAHAVELHYDARGRLAQLIDSSGRLLEFEHDRDGRIAVVTGPDPDHEGRRIALVRYEYDGENLVRVLDANGAPAHYRYRKKLLVQETDRNGLSFHFEYDGTDLHARCVRTWGDGGIYDHGLDYDDVHGITTVEDSLGFKTQYQHDLGLVLRTVDALGGVTTVAYDEYRAKVAVIDPLGRTTRWRYDERGNAIEEIAPDGATTLFEYDACDRRTAMCDAIGGRWQIERDEHGRVVEERDPLGQSTRFAYAAGRLVAIRDAAGGTTTLEYDAQHNVIAVHRSDGAVKRSVYDALGRAIASVDPNGNVEHRGYDLLGRLTRVDEPDGNARTLRYDGEGNLVELADDHGRVQLQYRGLGCLSARTEAGVTVRFEYDTEERLIGIVNAQGASHRFELGPTGAIESESGFDGLRREYHRDLAGQVIAIVAPEGATSLQYDRAGRIQLVQRADGSYARYAYRADGALIHAENATTTVVLERDRLGRLVRERQDGHWIASEYDARGARVRVQSSLGADQRFERDARGSVTHVRGVSKDTTPLEARFLRDMLGFELERNLTGTGRARIRRDRFGRPLELAIAAGEQSLRTRRYEWAKGDRLHAVTDTLHGSVRYGHDPLGRLAWSRHEDGDASLRVPDAAGNLFRREDRTDRRYDAGGRLLETVDPRGAITSFAYDAAGNLTEKRRSSGELWRYRWSADGTLREIERPDRSVVEFGYDAFGRRVYKRHGDRHTRFLWDGDVPLHEWTEGTLEPSAPITWLFEPDSFAPLAKLEAGACSAFVTDHLGTPLALLDQRGASIWSAELGIWGDLQRLEGERTACPFRWPGQYEDAETGLYYNRFRYYDPETGQYTSQDPIGLAGGLAPYAYVDDPLIWMDPLGLCKAAARSIDGEFWIGFAFDEAVATAADYIRSAWSAFTAVVTEPSPVSVLHHGRRQRPSPARLDTRVAAPPSQRDHDRDHRAARKR